ncbi:hypothetical protein, partial [Aliiruegeria sabulilitoris]|uniref:hypothetical protein n=1 Tax=Aliiruegeria sabulilitoris TaxID=1510458 RepID=UPI001E316A74
KSPHFLRERQVVFPQNPDLAVIPGSAEIPVAVVWYPAWQSRTGRSPRHTSRANWRTFLPLASDAEQYAACVIVTMPSFPFSQARQL